MLKEFYYVKTIVEEKSITKAAQKLFVAQPALTQYIHRIEQKMNITIFTRSNNGVTLTDEGKIFYELAKNITEQYDEFNRKIKKLQNRTREAFTIGASWYVQHTILPVVLADLIKIKSQEELRVIEDGSQNLLKQLAADDTLDVIFIHRLVREKLSLDPQLIYTPIFKEKIFFAASKSLGLKKQAHRVKGNKYPLIDIEKLADIPVVRFEDYQKIGQATNNILKLGKINPPILIKTHGFQNALELAGEAGGGIFLPKRYFENVSKNSHLVDVFSLDDSLEAEWELLICYRKTNRDKIKKFSDILRQYMNKI